MIICHICMSCSCVNVFMHMGVKRYQSEMSVNDWWNDLIWCTKLDGKQHQDLLPRTYKHGKPNACCTQRHIHTKRQKKTVQIHVYTLIHVHDIECIMSYILTMFIQSDYLKHIQHYVKYLQCASLTKPAYILHVLRSIWSLQSNCNSPQITVFSSSLPSCAPPLQLLANQQLPSADQWNELLANRHGEGQRTWHECTGVDNLES